MPTKIRLCPPIYTEVDTINQCRRTFRQIDNCRLTLEDAVDGQTLHAYDADGGTTLDLSESTVPLNTVATDTGSLFEWDTDDYELTVNTDSEIAFTYRLSVEDATSDTACVMLWLEKDDLGGGTWAEVPGSRCFLYVDGDTPS